jgi:hypothetical protein
MIPLPFMIDVSISHQTAGYSLPVYSLVVAGCNYLIIYIPGNFTRCLRVATYFTEDATVAFKTP